MKKAIVRYGIVGEGEKVQSKDLPNKLGKEFIFESDDLEVSDGYHTFDELYEHRITLYIKLCQVLKEHCDSNIWRSKFHSDGTDFNGWFILGVRQAKGEQITYHVPLSKWEDTNFAETKEKAPEFDGHTSEDVLERLKNL